jgi:hypothetical protein
MKVAIDANPVYLRCIHSVPRVHQPRAKGNTSGELCVSLG